MFYADRSPTAAPPRWVALAGMIDDRPSRRTSIRTGLLETWLWCVAALVLAIIGVGGATRLTDSGLSITEWQPILGAIPPLSEAAWQDAFAKYKQIPQYQLMNKGMSLEAFKTIYWWEWGHRQLGRVIGLAYVVPFLVLLAVGLVPRRLIGRLFAIAALIGLQGAVGWFMVQSGLSDNRIAVSPLRLTLHLSLAFTILGAIVWVALGLGHDRRDRAQLPPVAEQDRQPTLPRLAIPLATLLVALVFLQVLLGGIVAGTRAGLAYNTWPMMDGRLVPGGLLLLDPWWRNLAENVTTVQFNHRVAAYLLLAVAVASALVVARRSVLRWPALIVVAGVVAQAVLGIQTLLHATGGRIPIGLGVAHQVGGAIVFALAIWNLSRMMAHTGSARSAG